MTGKLLALTVGLLIVCAPFATAQDLDTRLVGVWEFVLKNENGAWTLRFAVAADGTYQGTGSGPTTLPSDAGRITAKDGHWRIVKGTGEVEVGTYEFDADGRWVSQGPHGRAVWQRVAEDTPPKVAPPKSAGGANLPGGGVKAETLREPEAMPPGLRVFIAGLDLMKDGKYAEASASFEKALADDATNTKFLTALGTALILQEKISEGLAVCVRSVKQNNKNRNARRMAALACRMLGDAIAAAQAYDNTSDLGIDLFLVELGSHYPMDKEAARKNFNEVARFITGELRTSGESMSTAQYALGVELFRNRDYLGAIRNFQALLETDPNDSAFFYYHARCCSELGSLDLARLEFTQLLNVMPALPEGYGARALNAARMGDAGRPQADLKIAAQLAPDRVKEWQVAVAAALAAAAKATRDPQEVWTALFSAAQAGKPSADLVALAMELRRGVLPAKLRYDESCQEERRTLAWALAADPGNPDRMADLAEWIWEHQNERVIEVEPNGPTHRLRYQPDYVREAEFKETLRLFDLALQSDPKHVPSLVGKGWMRLTEEKFDEAEQLCLQALAIRKDDPAAHEQLALNYDEVALQCRERAKVLRTPTESRSTRTETRSDGVYEVTTTTTIPPSPAALAEAAQLDERAGKLEAQRDAQVKDALAYAQGRPDEWEYRMRVLFKAQDYQACRQLLEAVVEHHPRDPVCRFRLARCYELLQQEALEVETHQQALQLAETSAEYALHVAYGCIDNRAWEGARWALEHARVCDPADPRVAAYLGIVAENNGKPEDAVAWFRQALAHDEARARMNGFSLWDHEFGSARMLCGRADYALTWMLRFKLARHLFAAQPEKAFELYAVTVANEERFPSFVGNAILDSANLPEPARPQGASPGGLPTTILFLQNRQLAGLAMARAGKLREAIQCFDTLGKYNGQFLAPGGPVVREYELPPSCKPLEGRLHLWVRLCHAEALLGQGNPQAAAQILIPQGETAFSWSSAARAATPEVIGKYNQMAKQLGLQTVK